MRKLGTCLVELSADSQNRDDTERLQKWVTEVNSIFAITCICKHSGLASFRRGKMDDATILPDTPPSDAVYHEIMVSLIVHLLCLHACQQPWLHHPLPFPTPPAPSLRMLVLPMFRRLFTLIQKGFAANCQSWCDVTKCMLCNECGCNFAHFMENLCV